MRTSATSVLYTYHIGGSENWQGFGTISMISLMDASIFICWRSPKTTTVTLLSHGLVSWVSIRRPYLDLEVKKMVSGEPLRQGTQVRTSVPTSHSIFQQRDHSRTELCFKLCISKVCYPSRQASLSPFLTRKFGYRNTAQGSTKMSWLKNSDFLFCFSCFDW